MKGYLDRPEATGTALLNCWFARVEHRIPADIRLYFSSVAGPGTDLSEAVFNV